MNKSIKKYTIIKSEKVNRMLAETSRYWLIAFCIFMFLRSSNNLATNEPSELSFILKEYNPFLVCLPVAFVILLALKFIEFVLIFLKSGETVLKDKSVLSFLVRMFHINYKADQLVLKDETILLAWQFMFCIFGFFIELKWYFLGVLGMSFYLLFYVTLSFKDIKKFMKSRI